MSPEAITEQPTPAFISNHANIDIIASKSLLGREKTLRRRSEAYLGIMTHEELIISGSLMLTAIFVTNII